MQSCLPAIKEHGVSWENIENMENMENMENTLSTAFIAMVEKIITQHAKEHDPESAQDGSASSELWCSEARFRTS